MDILTFISDIRLDLRDVAGDASEVLWTDAEIITYANDARNKLFTKVRNLIVDAFTNDDVAGTGTGLPVCEFAVTALTQIYELSPKVIEIKELSLASQEAPLTRITLKELSEGLQNWRTLPAGTPMFWCPELQTQSVVLIPAPAANDTVNMVVSRFPLDTIALPGPGETAMDMGFREEYHEDLKTWVMYRACSKKDAETFNPELAGEYRTAFEIRVREIREELTGRSGAIRNSSTGTMVV